MVISTVGVCPDPLKTKAVREMPFPPTLKHLRRALGMFSYYRKFIPKFADIANPLYEMGKKFKNNKKDGRKCIVPNEISRLASEKLKALITNEPVTLAFPVWDKPFEVHCDASKVGLSAVLCQVIETTRG